MKNAKVSKIFRFEEDDIDSFEKKYGKGLLTIFFRNCLEKAVDKNDKNCYIIKVACDSDTGTLITEQ